MEARAPTTQSTPFIAGWVACLRSFAVLTVALACTSAHVATMASANAMPTVSAQPPMNVLFILADDLGYSDTTLYGTTWFYETPNIQQLASRGMTFTNAYSASPVCSASRAAILTGHDPARRGFTGAGGHLEVETVQAFRRDRKGRPPGPRLKTKKTLVPVSATRMPLDVDNLAKAFKRHGYTTALFGKWHLGAAPHRALDHGFDVDVPSWSGPSTPYFAPWPIPEAEGFKPGRPGEHIDDRMTNEAIAFMEQHRDEPFFLNYWAFSVHSPFEARPDLVQKYAKRAHPANAQRSPVYAAMVEHFDSNVGKLLAALERLGLRERTIIVFTSDNGGSTYDVIDGHSVTSNAPLRGGKAQIYEGGFRVPTVVVWPGRVAAKSRSSALLSGVDWFPTLMEMLKLDASPTHEFDGVSQVSALRGGDGLRSSFVGYLPHRFPLPNTWPSTSVREGDWKLIRFHHDGPMQQDRFELYNLVADPGEMNDLSDTQPDRVRAMDMQISDYLSRMGAVIPVKNPHYQREPAPPAPEATKNPSLM